MLEGLGTGLVGLGLLKRKETAGTLNGNPSSVGDYIGVQ